MSKKEKKTRQEERVEHNTSRASEREDKSRKGSSPGNSDSDGGGSSGKLSSRPLVMWLLIALGLVLAFTLYQRHQRPTVELDTSSLLEHIAATNVVHMTFEEGSIKVRGDLRLSPSDPLVKDEWKQMFQIEDTQVVPFTSTVVSDEQKTEIVRDLRAQGVGFESKVGQNLWVHALLSFLPLILIILIIAYMINRQMKRGMGMAMNFGRSRARQSIKGEKTITFKDLAGCDEAKEEVSELIDYLKDPKKFEALGGRIPRGVILIGPPGTGKTLLAKAVAGEADVPFFSISGSDFVEMFVGVGAARVRDLFEQGKRNAPCIIFVDEIDAVGRQRGAGLGGGHDEREQTLNALLVEMDGFSDNDGVILIAATNRPDVLDPALLRPGRFDRQIIIDMPDIKGREQILQIHARKVRLSEDVDLSRIARGTPGFSGADLSNVINEAALLAARTNSTTVQQHHLEEARDKVRFGRERRSRSMDDDDKKITAYHEAGHALVMAHIPECEPLHKVTIIPRGIAYLGATMQLPEKDKYHQSKKEIEGQLAALFGGRVAEKIVFDDMTAGARSDIKTATEIARRMVCEWGMSDALGPMAYGDREEHLFLGREIDRHIDYSDETADKIDTEMRRIIDTAVSRAESILKENRDVLDRIATALIQYEVLEGEEVEQLIKGEEIRVNTTHTASEVSQNTTATDAESEMPEEKEAPKEETPHEKEIDEQEETKEENMHTKSSAALYDEHTSHETATDEDEEEEQLLL